MKVLFITRPTVFSGPGGDTIQLLNTKIYLEKLGIEVDIAENVMPNFRNYDVVHFFNLRNPQDLLEKVILAKKLNVPTVLSTIWGSYIECDRKCRKGIQKWLANNVPESKLEYLKALARVLINRNWHAGMLTYFLKGHLNSQKFIVENVDYLLPNSPGELERVRKDMNLGKKLGGWVANAVDTRVFDSEKVIVLDRFKKFEGCILCAARIEIRKSQLDLIRACHSLPYQLVIVGSASPNSIRYYEECRKEAEGHSNIVFIDHVTHDQLAQLYKVSKAHALISWMETPGLSSLEAGVMGCNLLITNRGDTEFYFSKMAEYAEPGDVESIRRGVVSVMEKDVSSDLKIRILENFTWQNTAMQTRDGYREVLKEWIM